VAPATGSTYRGALGAYNVGSLGYSINTLTVDSRTGWAYAASWDGPPSHVLVLDKDQLIAEIPVGNDVRGIAVDEPHDYIYAVNARSATLSVIRATEVITTLETGGSEPREIVVDETRGYIYVTSGGGVAVFGFEMEIDKPSFWQTFLPWTGK
jgi:DNA-binding beta-propeller fold protein YncE